MIGIVRLNVFLLDKMRAYSSNICNACFRGGYAKELGCSGLKSRPQRVLPPPPPFMSSSVLCPFTHLLKNNNNNNVDFFGTYDTQQKPMQTRNSSQLSLKQFFHSVAGPSHIIQHQQKQKTKKTKKTHQQPPL